MQITESSADGLKRTMKIVVSAAEISERFEKELSELKDKVQLKGFRKGKVPVVHIKKLYGRSVMGDVLDGAIKDTSLQAIEERKERPAMQPTITLPEDQAEIAQVVDGKADLAYSMSFEVLPQVDVVDLAALKLERIVADVDPADIDEKAVKMATSEELVCELAFRKAQAVSERHKDALVLGADTLILDNIGHIGKPSDMEEARDMLCRLSGLSHRVITGMALVVSNRNRLILRMMGSART